MRRVFLALWPNAAARQQLQSITANLRLSPRQRVKAENLHVTLVFIGAVDDPLLPEIIKQVANVTSQPFSLKFDQLSYWRRPRILCLTCSAPNETAVRLAADLSEPLTALGIDLDTRPYSPHITVARHVTVKPEIAIEPVVWRASGFALVESVSTRTGVVYQPLHHWRF